MARACAAVGAMRPIASAGVDASENVVCIELHLSLDDVPNVVGELLTDIRLLGLRPTLLSDGSSAWPDAGQRASVALELK